MLLSVVMITYGQEKYISKAINSVLDQKCKFDYELIISNDCSPDDTEKIIFEIVKNHPRGNLIKYLKPKKNLGMVHNFLFALNEAKSKYVALCEGDDYWTHELKLQKQVDFMELNLNYSMICHNAEIIYEDKNRLSREFIKKRMSYDIEIEDIVNKWIIPTASVLFRREFAINLPSWYSEIYSGDFSFSLILRHHGRIKFLNEKMSVYRVCYSGSSASSIYRKSSTFILEQHLKLLKQFNSYSNYVYTRIINKRVKEIEKEIDFYQQKEIGLLTAIIKHPLLFFQKSTRRIFNH